jgi:hypothetical protein
MSLRSPPYAKAVRTIAQDCLDGGHHRLLIFAGPQAWAAAKAYLTNGKSEDRREGHTLVLPPDETLAAAQYAWPVAQRSVVIADTGARDRQMEPLVDALVRDRARSAWHYVIGPGYSAKRVDFALESLHLGYPLIPLAYWDDLAGYERAASLAAAA